MRKYIRFNKIAGSSCRISPYAIQRCKKMTGNGNERKSCKLAVWLGCFLPGGNTTTEVKIAFWIRGGEAVCDMLGIICSPGLHGVNWSAKFWRGGLSPLGTPGSYTSIPCLPLGNRNQILSLYNKGILQRGVFVFPWFPPTKAFDSCLIHLTISRVTSEGKLFCLILSDIGNLKHEHYKAWE